MERKQEEERGKEKPHTLVVIMYMNTTTDSNFNHMLQDVIISKDKVIYIFIVPLLFHIYHRALSFRTAPGLYFLHLHLLCHLSSAPSYYFENFIEKNHRSGNNDNQ